MSDVIHELAEEFPAHVVCAWMGNTEAIARKHYLQVTDDHFAAAVKSGAQKRCTKSVQEQSRAGNGADGESRKPKQVPFLAGIEGVESGSTVDSLAQR